MSNLTGSRIETVSHVPWLYSLCIDRESKGAVGCVIAVAEHRDTVCTDRGSDPELISGHHLLQEGQSQTLLDLFQHSSCADVKVPATAHIW